MVNFKNTANSLNKVKLAITLKNVLLIPGMELLATQDRSVDKIKNVNYIGLIPVLVNGIK